MGCFSTTPEKAQSDKVEQELQKYASEDNKVIKMLLLGAGGCGKSTIFKQMKIIHQEPYTNEELEKYKDIVKRNILEIFQLMIWFAETNSLGLESDSFVETIKAATLKTFKLSPDLVEPLNKLWNSPAMKKAFERRAEYDLMDNTPFFVQNLSRMCAPNYLPNNDDILKTRVKTVGITENNFVVKKLNFKMVDVGGQRNERRKWIHAFDSVTCVIFVVALSEYNQVLAEEEGQNRMKESFKLFDDICNHKYFKNKPVIVFFNKNDLFEEKIKTVDLRECFEDYSGGCNAEAARQFIINKFMSLNTNKKSRKIYQHITTATSTENVKVVFDGVRAIILKDIIEGNGMM